MQPKNLKGAPRKLTREDVAMVMELLTEGVKISYIAHYVYGITVPNLRSRMSRFLK